jgi:hypothetical protein
MAATGRGGADGFRPPPHDVGAGQNWVVVVFSDLIDFLFEVGKNFDCEPKIGCGGFHMHAAVKIRF